jgi:hypothetical protein
VDQLPVSVCLVEDIYAYPWHIETKYYSADVSLCTTDSRTVGDKSFADSIHAFVVTFDSKMSSSLDQVAMWLPYLKELQPAVQLLVCDHCADGDAISRSRALHWCLDNSFELIELNSSAGDSDCSDEDDFKETVGIQRIIEALSCHSWPNLIMKENPTFRSAFFEQMMIDAAKTMPSGVSDGVSLVLKEECAVTNDSNRRTVDDSDSASCIKPSSNSPTPQTTSELSATEVMMDSPAVNQLASETTSCRVTTTADTCTAADEESFEQLFERLQIMKDAAAGMSSEDRKKYAEQVTMQFWQAIGGNPDELEGLSDLDSD